MRVIQEVSLLSATRTRQPDDSQPQQTLWNEVSVHCLTSQWVHCGEAENKAALLSICITEEETVMFRFGQKVFKQLKFTQVWVLNMGTMHYTDRVYEWTAMFKTGRESVTNSEHSGCPSMTTNRKKSEPWFSRT
jgi:hypothetical protein